MKFKTFIEEKSPFLNREVQNEINNALVSDIDNIMMLTPDAGVQRMRKVLMRYDIDFPPIEDLDSEGDENIMKIGEEIYLYFIYYPTDDGNYEFHAEIADEDGVDEILSDMEEDIES